MNKKDLHKYLVKNGKKGSAVQKDRHKSKLSEWGKRGGRPRKTLGITQVDKASR